MLVPRSDCRASPRAPLRRPALSQIDPTHVRVEGLQQKAGVAAKQAAPSGAEGADRQRARHRSQRPHRRLPDGGYFVEDDGGGIDGTPEEIARLFSIARPMVSTKLLRLPTRGALGNGLRVVAGAVLASDGFLVVTTRNRGSSCALSATARRRSSA